MKTAIDDDGATVRAGNKITFNYGIPPVHVCGPVVEIDGELWVLTTGHDPNKCKLADLRRHVGSFYKQ